MTNLVKIILKQGKEAAVSRFHPWIFSGAVLRIEGHPAEGDVVAVYSYRKEFLALGHFSPDSITVKIFSFSPTDTDEAFWRKKIENAYALRKSLGYTSGVVSNAYRLVFSEGDGLPGLIIDYYNGVAVIQTHTLGMYRALNHVVEALRGLYGEELTAVYDKSADTLSSLKQKGRAHDANLLSNREADHFLFGSSGPVEIMETGHRFVVDFIHGQKTGFFLDQRANRMYAQFYARQRRVLNACCYSGAFSVYALKGDASQVLSLDSSAQALRWTEENVALNGFGSDRHAMLQTDVKQYLTSTDERFDMIILDPPAFAKTRLVYNNALHAYIHINEMAMRCLNPGGLLITFSCSQPVTREMFRSAIQSAAINSKRSVKILHTLSQGSDHPVDACHPEGEYLKGIIAGVGD